MKPTEFHSPTTALTKKLNCKTRAQRDARKAAIAMDAVAGAPRHNDVLPELKLERRSIDALHAPARAVRKVTTAHVADIARSISAFGVVRPVLISGDGEIVDGVSTVEAARSLGLGIVPCVIVDHLTKQEVRLVRLALNRVSEKGEWDIGELKLEFQELIDLDAPIRLAGFEPQEIDIILMQDDVVIDPDANTLPDPSADPEPVSREGDLWRLGRHRLLCGDATNPKSYAELFSGTAAAGCVFTDPPWNLNVDGFLTGSGQTHHREFVDASGEMTEEEFIVFLTGFLVSASHHVEEGAVMFVCMDWRHIEHLQQAARAVGLMHLTTVVWVKGHGGLGGLYRSAHEFVLVFKKGLAPIHNNVGLGRHGRDRTNVWNYPGANQRGSSASEHAADHPTPKPVELVGDALLNVSDRGDIVLDPFCGSGTTIIAAEKSGRIAYALEKDARYVDLIVRRWQHLTGHDAVDDGTGKTFNMMADERHKLVADDQQPIAETASSIAPEDVTIIKAKPVAVNVGDAPGEVSVTSATKLSEDVLICDAEMLVAADSGATAENITEQDASIEPFEPIDDLSETN